MEPHETPIDWEFKEEGRNMKDGSEIWLRRMA